MNGHACREPLANATTTSNALAPSRRAEGAINGQLGAQGVREWTLRAGIAMCTLCLCSGEGEATVPAFRAARRRGGWPASPLPCCTKRCRKPAWACNKRGRISLSPRALCMSWWWSWELCWAFAKANPHGFVLDCAGGRGVRGISHRESLCASSVCPYAHLPLHSVLPPACLAGCFGRVKRGPTPGPLTCPSRIRAVIERRQRRIRPNPGLRRPVAGPPAVAM